MAKATQGPFQLITDGGCQPNPGPGAIAWIIIDDRGKERARRGEFIGEATNNVAEYRALIKGLTECLALTRGSVLCLSDSELVIKQLNGRYKVRAERLKPLFEQVERLAARFAEASFEHRPREDARIAIADRIVRETRDRQVR